MTIIQHAIGLNFSNELSGAGLLGLPISWGTTWVQYDDTVLTSNQVIRLQSIIMAHDSTVIPIQTSDQARINGEAYVARFFTVMEMMELAMMLMNPATPIAQLTKVQAIDIWRKTIEAAWLTSPASFDPTTFGNPPHSYAEILSITN